jgi:hypothetical protein
MWCGNLRNNVNLLSSKKYLFYLGGSRFELRALHWHLLGRCSTTWAIAPALFCFSYFLDRAQVFAWGLPQTKILLPTTSWVARITGVNHHVHLQKPLTGKYANSCKGAILIADPFLDQKSPGGVVCVSWTSEPRREKMKCPWYQGTKKGKEGKPG